MSTERTPEQQAADEKVVASFRVACERFLAIYVEEVIKRTGLSPLALSVHEHKSLLVDRDKDEAMLVRVRFEFGHLIDRGDLEELISAAENSPGSVGES